MTLFQILLIGWALSPFIAVLYGHFAWVGKECRDD